MLKKNLSFAAMLAASVTSTVALKAGSGFDYNQNLIISAKKLKEGQAAGELTLKSGQKFKVEGSIDPIDLQWDKEKLYGVQLNPGTYNFCKFFCDLTTMPPYSSMPMSINAGVTLTLLTSQEPLEFTNPANMPTPQEPAFVRTSLKEEIRKEDSAPSLIVKPSKVELKEEAEIKPQVASVLQFKIIKEQPLENQAPQKTFYTRKDPKTGLFVNMEYLTPAAVKWWLNRLGAEAFFEYAYEIDRTEFEFMNMSNEQHMAMEQRHNEIAENWGAVGASVASYNPLPQDLQDAKSIMSYYDRSDEKLNQRQFTPSTMSYMGGSLIPAWRGFKYNLDQAQTTPTWVSYITTEELENPLSSTQSVTSPHLLMAMTATLSSSFYSPLGIYKSPISTAHEENGKHRNLSLMFHSATAQMMEEVNPDYKYAVVRPLGSMMSIFEKSGISLSKSKGNYQETDKPYVRVRTPHQHRWYEEADTLSPKETELFGSTNPYGDSSYVLVDSQNNTYTQIGSKHPFTSSPFLGGMKRDNFETFPFVTIKREDLVNFGK